MWARSLAKSFLQLYLYSIHTQRVRLFLLFVRRCDTFSRVRALFFAYTALVERQPQLQRTQQQVILWNWNCLRGPNIESNLFFYICPVVLLCIASLVFYFSFHFILSALSRHNQLTIHSLHLILANVDNRFIESVVKIFGMILFKIRCLARATLLPLLTLLFTHVHVCFPALVAAAVVVVFVAMNTAQRATTTKKSVNKRRELNWKRLSFDFLIEYRCHSG